MMIPSSASARLAVVLVLGAVTFGACGGDDGPTNPDSDLPAPNAQALLQYLGEEAYQTSWSLWPGTTAKGPVLDVLDPHTPATSIYVNATAALALQLGQLSLPTGGIVVKENYSAEESLESITTMYKYPGFSPDFNDWFWLETDPNGAVLASGVVDSCIQCHGGALSTDYLWQLSRQ